MTTTETPRSGLRRARPLAALTASLAAVLLASGCAAGGSADASSSAPHPASDHPASSSAAPAAQKRAVGEGQGDPNALAGVHVETGADRQPSVKLDGPVKTDKASTRVLSAGDGPLPVEGDIVKVSTVVIDPSTGAVQAENFSASPQVATLDANVKQMYPEMYELLTTTPVGSIVAAYSPETQAPVQQQGSASPSASPSTQTVPAQLFAYRIDGIVPKAASGAEVKDLDSRLPKVTVDGSGKPGIEKPSGQAPGELVVQPLIQGDGPVVNETDAVTVQYTGVKWSDGSTFDSSWDSGSPATFGLDQVIPGWKEGLKGQKVGSRVLLSVPAAKAYGEQGSQPKIGPNEDLLFVVDILDAQAAPAGPSGQPSPSGQ